MFKMFLLCVLSKKNEFAYNIILSERRSEMDAFFISESFVYLNYDTRRFKSNTPEHFQAISDCWPGDKYVFIY